MDPLPPPGGDDDKWKWKSKGRSRSGRPHAMASTCSVLSRSYSATTTSTRISQQEGSSSKKKQCVVKEAVKEHRARFYIVRRCVSMLVCWRDY